MVLLHDRHCELFTNAAFTFVADCNDVDSVLHDLETDGKESCIKSLTASRQHEQIVTNAPTCHRSNDIVAQGLPQGRRQASVTAHANAAIFALVEGCHGREHEHVTRLGFADETGDHGDELVFDEGGGHG